VEVTSEAGAAACGTNVLVLAGRPNRTFVLLLPKCHLNVTVLRKLMRGRLGERIGAGRTIGIQTKFTYKVWLASQSLASNPSPNKNRVFVQRLLSRALY